MIDRPQCSNFEADSNTARRGNFSNSMSQYNQDLNAFCNKLSGYDDFTEADYNLYIHKFGSTPTVKIRAVYDQNDQSAEKIRSRIVRFGSSQYIVTTTTNSVTFHFNDGTAEVTLHSYEDLSTLYSLLRAYVLEKATNKYQNKIDWSCWDYTTARYIGLVIDLDAKSVESVRSAFPKAITNPYFGSDACPVPLSP